MTQHRDSAPPADGESDIRPLVARARSDGSPWLFIGLAGVGAIALFLTLDGQREKRTAPASHLAAADRTVMIAPLPPLVLPPEPPPPPGRPALPEAAPVATPMMPPVMAGAPQFQPPPVYAPPPVYSPPPSYTPPVSMPAQPSPISGAAGSVLVIDTAAGDRPEGPAGGVPERIQQLPSTTPDTPVRSTQVRRPASTVAQGTLIPAVLETALDSTRPGLVRAIVSGDVVSFDGRRILIPRGSHLTGEYQADLTAGQTRAMVRWTRLVRPDGETIALDSPAADLQGRTGVTGRIDSRFLQRFSRAVLQTTLNIGTSLATREIGGDRGVTIALPGSGQTTGTATGQDTLQPILRIDAGARIAVFVARDLEFTSGEPRR